MDQNDRLYECKICIKPYSSYKSLWNHNKKYHNNEVNQSKPEVNIIKYVCKYCNKELSCKQSKWKHEKACNKSEINLLKEKINKLEKKIDKSSNKTINDNKQINNGTINNNNINIKVSLGNENIDDLSKKDQLKILNSGYMGLIKIIELLNLNPDLPQYNNILVTNLKDKS
jgi:flagellar motility protein MotE (MotC chaperone)